MRLIALLLVFVCAAVAANEPVRADPIGAASQPAASPPSSTSVSVSVMPFEIGTELPQWLGASFKQSIEQELQAIPKISVATLAATRPSRAADYTIRGRCTGSQFLMVVEMDVLQGDSTTIIHSVKVSGQPSELLQIKDALRKQTRELFLAPKASAAARQN